MKLIFSSLFILVLSASSYAQSTNLYAGYVRWSGAYSDSLAVIDTTGGVYSIIEHRLFSTDAGTFNGCYGLSLHPSTGEMYILYQTNELDEASRRIGVLDTATGVITDIGISGNLTDIDFSADGVLYGTTGSVAAAYKFVEVDITDASITDVFVHISPDYGPSIGYDYFNSRFLKMDRGDGVSFIEGEPLAETAVSFTDHPGEIHAITFKNDSIAIAVNYDEFYEFNMNTGVFTGAPVYTHLEYIHALAFGKNPFAIVATGPTTFCSNDAPTLFLTEDDGTDFQWFLDGEAIDGATETSYIPSESGSYTCDMDGRLTSPLTITVIPAPNASFTATPNPVYLGDDITGTVEFENTSDAGDEYYWDFDNDFVSILENPSFSFTSAGSYDVMFIVTDSETGCSDTAYVTVEVAAGVGIVEQLHDQFKVYPTTANNEVNIKYISAKGSYNVQLIDLSGAVVASQIINPNELNSIDISTLESGIYVMKIFNENQEGIFRIVKQ